MIQDERELSLEMCKLTLYNDFEFTLSQCSLAGAI